MMPVDFGSKAPPSAMMRKRDSQGICIYTLRIPLPDDIGGALDPQIHRHDADPDSARAASATSYISSSSRSGVSISLGL